MIEASVTLMAALFAIAPAALAAPDVLKEVPKDGTIARGKVVYADDGKCPKGEIKEITGGSQQLSIPRKTRCIKRRAESK